MSEYEPKDSRNVTGTASTRDGRWTNRAGRPPLANGEVEEPQDYDASDEDEDDEDDLIEFEPDAELLARLARKRAH
jgi:hypothetical protein